MSVLHRDEIARLLETLPGWHHRGNAIEKHFDRGNFDGSMRFVNAVAEAANAQDHHPDMTISWNEVTMTLSSHDVGGLTARDFRLAEAIDVLAS
jgi:4a-hydroxytetrahydrobiopterin dehydratase